MSAAARYDELVVRHPEAFVDHAAEFWLTVVVIGRRGSSWSWAITCQSTRALHRVVLSDWWLADLDTYIRDRKETAT